MNFYHLTIAWRNLVQGGRRVRLLGLALTAVAGLLILLLALSNGIHENLVKAATTIASVKMSLCGASEYRMTVVCGSTSVLTGIITGLT